MSNKIKIGDHVKVPFGLRNEYHKGIVCNIVQKCGEVLYQVEVKPGVKPWYRDVWLKLVEKDVTKLQIKTNIIDFNNGQLIMSWDLADKNNLRVKVHEGRASLINILRILLKEVDGLQHFAYKRVSPYKIIHKRPADTLSNGHLFSIQFIDIKDNNKIKENVIMKTDNTMGINKGVYNFFIPDLLEVAKNFKMVSLSNNIYSATNIEEYKLNIKYIDDSMSRGKLVSDGWIVPDGYKEPLL